MIEYAFDDSSERQMSGRLTVPAMTPTALKTLYRTVKEIHDRLQGYKRVLDAPGPKPKLGTVTRSFELDFGLPAPGPVLVTTYTILITVKDLVREQLGHTMIMSEPVCTDLWVLLVRDVGRLNELVKPDRAPAAVPTANDLTTLVLINIVADKAEQLKRALNNARLEDVTARPIATPRRRVQ